jgi:hypothetical protein
MSLLEYFFFFEKNVPTRVGSRPSYTRLAAPSPEQCAPFISLQLQPMGLVVNFDEELHLTCSQLMIIHGTVALRENLLSN